MKKLVQITTQVNSGSVGRIAEEIGMLAINRGWQSYIAYGRNPRSSASNLIRIGSDGEVRMHGIKTRLLDGHGFGSKRATLKLVNQLRKINPDIIHLHNIHGYFIHIGVLFNYLAKARIPVVWTLHDCWAMTGHCVHFEDIGCQRWKTGCYNCPNKAGYPTSVLLDNSKNNFHRKKRLFQAVDNLTIVPVCDWLANIVKESFFQNKSVRTIYNGVDTSMFRPITPSDLLIEKFGIRNKFVILAVSNGWNETKGLGDIIELSGCFDSSTQIIIVGVSTQQMKLFPSSIIGLERTESMEQLAELYSVADVFINPTYQDTLPTVNIESIACGTPVISYHTGGSADIINEETGYVISVGDKTAMIEALVKLREKGKKAYAEKCRNKALCMFRREDRFSQYIDLYDELVNIKALSDAHL